TSRRALRTTAVRDATSGDPKKTRTRRLRPGFGRSGRAAVPLRPRPEHHDPLERVTTLVWTRTHAKRSATSGRPRAPRRPRRATGRRLRTYGRGGPRDCRDSRARA